MTRQLTLGHGRLFGILHRHWAAEGLTLAHRLADGDVAPHQHEDAHLVVVTGGRYETSAAGAARADAPVFVFNPAGTFHRDRFAGGRGSFFSLSLSPARLAALADGIALPERAEHVGHPGAHGLTRRLLLERWERDEGLTLESLALELLCALAPSGNSERTPPAWLKRAHDLLQDSYRETLSLGAVAHDAGVHPVHLTRSFRRFFHCTPGDFLRARRLERAAALLAASALPLSEVALASGFADQSHFNRHFRRVYGVPPGAYRAAVAA